MLQKPPTYLSMVLCIEVLVILRSHMWNESPCFIGFSSTWTENFQMYKLGLEKAEKPEIKFSTSTGSWRKQGSSASLTPLKPLTMWITTNCGKFLKRWEFQTNILLLLYWLRQSLWLCGSQQTVENSERDGNTRPPDLPPEKSVCRLKLDMEQQTGSKSGKEYIKAVYCHLLI